MSEQNVLLNPPPSEFAPLVVYPWELSNLEGKLLTIIESLGLAAKQEEAAKGLVRQAIWDKFNHSLERLYVYQDAMEAVLRSNDKSRVIRSDVPAEGVKKSK